MTAVNHPAAGDTLVFAHGNGFPGGTYAALFRIWRDAGLKVEAVDRFGHDPRHPVTSNWPHLRDELLEFTEACSDQPVWLVGHSLGGILSLMVACRKPRRVKGLVMLDSPVVAGWRAHSVHVFKASGLMPKVSPGKVSQRRRHIWPSREAVQEHFERKAVFARWAPEVLADYVNSGFEERDGQWQLRFDRLVETRIYNTLPHQMGELLRRHPPKCPVGFVAGTHSLEMRQGGSAAARRLAGSRYRLIEGGHLFPMERPQETAQLVLELLEEMATTAHII